jgi:hypothetical protein
MATITEAFKGGAWPVSGRSGGVLGRSHSPNWTTAAGPICCTLRWRRPSFALQNDQPLAACDAGVEKVPLQHGLSRRDILTLGFVDVRGIGRHHYVEFPKSVR